MAVERIEYRAGNLSCNGALVYDESVSGRRPLLLMAPNWLGVTDHAIKRAAMMAGRKYVAFVVDMYGGGKVSAGPPESAALANAVRADAPERRRRIAAALDTLRSESDKRGIGDLKRQAAVGFCFGGGNVLELARTGADLQAVICLHGDLATPLPANPAPSRPRSACCTAPRIRSCRRRPAMPSKPKWKLPARNGRCWCSAACCTRSAEEESNAPGIGQYDPGAARQCYAMIDDFATAAFEGKL